MAKYRKRPVVIDAVRLTRRVTIHTLEGDMVGEPGDWLITGVKGERYPCKDDVFQATYEPVTEGGELVAATIALDFDGDWEAVKVALAREMGL